MSADTPEPAASVPAAKPLGMRKNGTWLPGLDYDAQENKSNLTRILSNIGKQWHAPRQAFRPTSGLTSYEKRQKQRLEMDAMKAKEREMKEEKEAERKVWRPHSFPHAPSLGFLFAVRWNGGYMLTNGLQRRTQAIKEKKEKKAEKERYEMLEAKMHKKRVERLKRREKRNKLLNS